MNLTLDRLAKHSNKRLIAATHTTTFDIDPYPYLASVSAITSAGFSCDMLLVAV